MRRLFLILLLTLTTLGTAEAQRQKKSVKDNPDIEELGYVRNTYSRITKRLIDGTHYYVYSSQTNLHYDEPFKLLFTTAKEAIKSFAHLKIFAEREQNNATMTFANDGRMITVRKGKFIGKPYVEFTVNGMEGYAQISVKELEQAIHILSKYIEAEE